MLNSDASQLVEEKPPGKYACDMVRRVDEWRGDRVRSRLCVRQLKAEGVTDVLFAGTPDTFFIKSLLAKAASCKDFESLVVGISVALVHARTDEEICVKLAFRCQEFKILTTQGSSEWNEESKALARVLMQQARVNYAFPTERHQSVHLQTALRQVGLGTARRRFSGVCGLTSNLDFLAGEFKNHFLVKTAEVVSSRPEHQQETHFLKRRISVENFGWHVELDQRYVKSLLDAMAMNHCKSMATPGSKGQESSHVGTENLDPQEHREFRSGAGICQFLTEQRCDIAFSTKEIMREAA